MKKILTTIVFILICYLGYGQTYPVPINVANAPTQIGLNNAFKGKLIITSFVDTTAANAEGYLKNYDGALIKTVTPANAIWYRELDSAKWVMIQPQGGGTPVTGQAWINPGNFNLFTDSKLNGGFGTLQANGIYIKTNGVTRAYLDRYGIAPETGTTVGIGIDPSDSNRITFFTGGSSSTPTWQETLTAGSTLNTANTVTSGNNNFAWNWDTKTNGSGLTLGINGTAALGNQTVLSVNTQGANAIPAITSYGVQVSNTKTGTSNTNYALKASSSGGSVNFGIDASATTSVGSGDTYGAQIIGTGNGTVYGVRTGASGGTVNHGLYIAAGDLAFQGSSSGLVSIMPAAAAGTWTMTLPTTDGNSGEFLQTDGNGVTSWAAASSSGANTALSNLASVAVNTSILPGTDNAIDLGSSSKQFRTGYFGTSMGIGGTPTHALSVFSAAGGTDLVKIENTNASGYASIGFFNSSNAQVGGFGYANAGIAAPVTDAIYFYSSSKDLVFSKDVTATSSMTIRGATGTVGIATGLYVGSATGTATAKLHISAGSTAASSAPIKFTAGTNMTAAEAGAMEWDGTNLFITQTTGPTRKTIAYTTDLTGLPYWALTGTSSLTGASTIDMAGFDLTINNSAANDEVFLVAVNPGLVEFKLVADTKKAYLLSGAIAAGADGDALTIVDHTTGELGSAPNLAFQLHKQNTDIGATDGKVWVSDSVGNKTIISPHYFPSDIKPSEDMAWSFYSRNEKIGKEIFIDMLLLARKVEQLTGEKLVYINDIKK